jgi:hypothetical protein
MKKFFAIAFIAASLAACNNSGKSDKPAEDTTQKTDTGTVVTPPPTNDTTNTGGDTTMTKDTSVPKM